MLEDQSQEVDLLEDGAEIQQEAEPESGQQQEEKPAPRGYMSKEAWIESGKDPEKWVSEEEFKATGERIKLTNKIRNEIKSEFENQLKNVNLLHQIQLRNQREELMGRRDDAIDIADKDAVKAIDKQIKELDKLESLAENQGVQAKPAEVMEWEADNPWCNDPNDPRLTMANRIYADALNSGKTIATALRMVDKEISSKFSEKKPSQQIVEGVRQSASRAAADTAPTMKTLTRDEQKAWDSGLFDNEKDFLKAVAADRKGTK